jgi:hypothetical protein
MWFHPGIAIGQTTPGAAGDTVRVFNIDPPVPVGAKPPDQGIGSGLFEGFLGQNVAASISGGPLTLVLGAPDSNGVAQLSLQNDVTIAIHYVEKGVENVVDNGCVCVKLLAEGSNGSVACQGGVAYGTSIITSGPASWTAQVNQGLPSGNNNGDLVVMGLIRQIPDLSCNLVDCTVGYPDPASANVFPFTTAVATASADPLGGPSYMTAGAPFDCASFGASGSGGALATGLELNAPGNIPRIHTLRLSNAEPDLTPTVPSPTSAPPTATDTPPDATTTPLTPTSTATPTATSVPAGRRVRINIGSAEGMPGDIVTFSVGVAVEPVISHLSMPITSTDIAVPLDGIDNFPSVPQTSHAPIGTIRIDNELISYTGATGKSLTGVTRGFGTSTAQCMGDTPPPGCPAAHDATANVILQGPVEIVNEIGFSADAPIMPDPTKPFPACTGPGGSFSFQCPNIGPDCTTMLAVVRRAIGISTDPMVYTCSVAISPSAMSGQAFPLSCSGAGLIPANATDLAGAPLITTCSDGQILVPEPTAVSTATETMTSPPATATDTPSVPPDSTATATGTEAIASPTTATEMPTSTATATPPQTTTGSPAIPTKTATAGGVATVTHTATVVGPTVTTGIPTRSGTPAMSHSPTLTAGTRTPGTPTPTRSATGTAQMALTPTVTATGGGGACVGDCDGSGTVSVGDLITLVNILLGDLDASACSKGISAGAHIDIALIIRGVNSLLSGCPA